MSSDDTDVDGQDAGRDASALTLIRADRPGIRHAVVVRRLAGGFSEASVLVCDLAETEPSPGEAPLHGQYILKVSGVTSDPQADKHRSFSTDLNGFAAAHVPKLVLATSDASIAADVYEIANHGFRTLRTAEDADYNDQRAVVRKVAGDLLEAQLACANPVYDSTLGTTLESWVPNLFVPGRRQDALLSLAEDLNAGTRPLMVYQGEYLPNPVHVWTPEHSLYEKDAATLNGRSHGDLHLRNILMTGSERTRNSAYWIIDVNWGEPTALLYDQAYLEASVFINGLRHDGARSPLAMFSQIDGLDLTRRVITLPRDQGVLELVQSIREATVDALERMELRRKDIWELQYPLARVAAGLNWATKPQENKSDAELRTAAFIYAAWATKVLIHQHFPQHWEGLVEAHETVNRRASPPPAARRPITTEQAQELLAPFLRADGSEDLYLVGDEGIGLEPVGDLASTPWTAVIDLDPVSEQTGMSSVLEKRLPARQFVVRAGVSAPSRDRDGMVWLHANGWSSRLEPRPADFTQWRVVYLPTIRRILENKCTQTGNRAAAVLLLRSGSNDREIGRIREAIEECYDGNVRLVELTTTDAGDDAHDLNSVLEAVRPTLPVVIAPADVVIPGQHGPVAIPLGDQAWIGTDLEVLHSGVVAQAKATQRRDDEFWQGRPPTWTDLAAGLDVVRHLESELRKDLARALSGARAMKFDLLHSPGAGGTTLARRIAWDLSSQHPTVLLRQYSSGTVARLEELVKITNRTVLMVAEAADVSDAEHEDLQAGLHRHHVRVVTLRVMRANVKDTGDDKRRFLLTDPMRPIERAEFARLYQPLAVTPTGADFIRRLGQNDPHAPPPPPQWLSPFFFGLCAYEQEFTGVVAFVSRHLERLNPAQRQLAKYLALVTRFGQVGLPLHLLRFLITGQWTDPQLDRPVEDELRALLGEDLRHLTVIDRGSARLMHPHIAERVLEQLLGGADPQKWKLNLAQASVEFITMLTGALGSDNMITRGILENLFVRRTKADENRGGNFSELIMNLSPDSAHSVLEQLTIACPREPHFLNHLGRHLIYETKDDYRKAEQCLLRAVELSNGRDSLHLHTLGLVRRIWIEQELREVIDSKEPRLTPEMVRDRIADRFALAMDAFARARTIAPDDEHSYITPVQLVIFILDRLRRISAYESLPDLIGSNDAIAGWVSEQFAVAGNLLDDYRTVKASYATKDSRYFRNVENRIEELYGNVEFLIEQWQAQLEDNENRASIGRALARAHLWRARRNWSLLDEPTLREIAECLDSAMRITQPTEADLRTWFQAYRRLPEYDALHARARLSDIVRDIDSLEAHYYLSILHFLRWRRGEEHNQDAIRAHIDRARQLARTANSQWSYEWVGLGPAECPLVHFSELGEWSGSFWNYVAPLERVEGVIETVENQQFGRIKVDGGRLTARFTPREKFRPGRDDEAPVDFFLGFSYEGLRAWEVEHRGQWKPSKAQQGGKPYVPPLRTYRPKPVVPEQKVKLEPVEAPPAAPPAVRPPMPVPVQRVQVDNDPLPLDNPAQLIKALIAREGGELDLMTLGSQLTAALGTQRYQALRAGRGLKRLVEDLGFAPSPHGSNFLIRNDG